MSEEYQNEPPSTPTRGRIASRYPASLARGDPGHVPLHRRGTSHTYERLEDLLREAGYKETRIFTPETERTDRRTEDNEGTSVATTSRVRSGVGAVVDFLSGWMVGGGQAYGEEISTYERTSDEVVSGHRPYPPSPLAGKRAHGMSSLNPERLTTRSLRPQSSASDSLRAYAQISAAQGYLRHMASAPNMAKRMNRSSESLATRPSSSSADHQLPPMPSNWLDSVTKAVLGSSSSAAHVGGPFSIPTSRSMLREGQPALSDRTNKIRPALGYLRAKTAPGTVNTVRVVCRSAPTSRSSSRAGNRLAHVSDRGKQREMRRSNGKKLPENLGDSVPSLASNRLENDAWGLHWVDGRRVSSISQDEIEDSDDDEEEELDLARLLVPPKRQHSIHSLRRHLHRSESARALRAKASRHLEPWVLDDDEDTSVKRSGSRRDSMDEEYGPSWRSIGISGVPEAKKRRGLNGTVTNAGAGRP